MIKVTYIANKDSGEPRDVEIRDGISVEEFFDFHHGGELGAYSVRVNSLAAKGDEILKNGDKIVIAPKKVDGGK